MSVDYKIEEWTASLTERLRYYDVETENDAEPHLLKSGFARLHSKETKTATAKPFKVRQTLKPAITYLTSKRSSKALMPAESLVSI